MWGGTERFEVRRRLGEGGMGVVYEAYDRERKMSVAVKTLRNINPSAVYRFKREFRLLTGVAHPNLISLYELLSIDGQWLFTMELVDGVDFVTYICGELEQLSESQQPTKTGRHDGERSSESTTIEATPHPAHGNFDIDRLRSTLLQLSEGIAALHDSGHLHQDIKPSNVLVTKEGRVVLLDFGVMSELGAPDWRGDASDRGGTPAYMAPERYGDDRSASESSDWYSVGVMLFRVLAGRKPFTGKPKLMLAAKRREDPPAPRAQKLGVPEDLNDLCVSLLNPDPARRPPGDVILAILRQTETNVSIPVAPREQPTLLIGRDDELAQLGGALDRTRDSASMVFVSGLSGIGKSTLVRGFLDDLAKDGEAIVLAGRCYERETVPYKAIDSLIDALYRFMVRQSPKKLKELIPKDIRLLARMFPVLDQLGSVVDAPRLMNIPAPQAVRRRAFAALRQLLHKLTARRSVVLAIDDLQWGDVDSAALLDAVMRPPDAPPLLLVVSYRSEDAESAPAIKRLLRLSSEWEPSVHTSHVPVEPLGAHAARKLAARLMERDAEASAVRSVIAEASGHPYLIQELAHFAETTHAEPELTNNISLERVLSLRISRLDEPARKILELVAVADRPTRQSIIESAADISRAERATLFQSLESERLVRLSGMRDADTIGVYHNRIRETITAGLTEPVRAAHHQSLAIAIQRSDYADPETLTVHFAGAGETERAGYYAALAARQAADTLAFDRAADLYRLALSMGSHEIQSQRSLEIDLAYALAHAGRGAEAADAFLVVAETADPLARLDYRREAARQLMVVGHVERGLATMRGLLDEVEIRYPDTVRSALSGLLRRRLWLRLRGLRWKPRREQDIPVSELAGLEVEQAVADGLAMIDNIRGAYFQARALRTALRLGEETRIARALSRETVFLASVGGKNIPRAENRLKRMREISERSGDPDTRAWIHVAEGFVRYFGGRFREAQQCFQDAELVLRTKPIASTLELTNARLFRLFAFRRMGLFRIGQRLVNDYVRDAERRGDLYAETSMRRACNFFWLVADDPDGADRDLRRTLWTPPDTGFHLQHWYEMEARGEIELYRGVTEASFADMNDRIAALNRSMLTRVQILRVLARSLEARFLLAQPGDAATAKSTLARVSKIAARMCRENMAYATAWGLLLQAAVANRRAQTTLAIDLLTRAAAGAEACDLHVHAAAARRRRGQITGGSEGARLVDEADQFLHSHDVAAPNRLANVLVPGFAP